MGIQHKTLPMAAVQFHPESILTSPIHGLSILENALTNLKYSEDESEPVTSGAEIVASLEALSLDELKARLVGLGISTNGTKSELVVRLTLWEHKSREARAGRISFDSMSEEALIELKQGLGLKGKADTSDELVEILETCLLDSTKK